MKKLMILLMAALPMLAMAQEKVNVKVDSVGKLATQLGDQKFKVADLTVSGTLNGTDLKLLQEIVTRTKVDKKNPGECLVTALDLSGVTIMESKDKGGLKTQANELPKSLFSDAKNLVKVVLPSGIRTISKGCFSGCKSLVDVTIPASVTTIETEAFQDCESLAAISLPSGLKTLGNEAFEGCKSLVTIVLPNGIDEIAPQAFNKCKSLKSINIPDGTKKIGGSAFKSCESLTNMTLPSSVDEIESAAFDGCSDLETIQMASVKKVEPWHSLGVRT